MAEKDLDSHQTDSFVQASTGQSHANSNMEMKVKAPVKEQKSVEYVCKDQVCDTV